MWSPALRGKTSIRRPSFAGLSDGNEALDPPQLGVEIARLGCRGADPNGQALRGHAR